MNKHLLMALLLITVTHANGTDLLPFGPTDTEMVFMPDYCKAKFGGPKTTIYQAWAGRAGKHLRIWEGMHHFCAGLNNMNRYLRLTNNPKRAYYLSRAVPEMNYNLSKLPDDFILAGEMYLNRGLAYQLMNKQGEATIDFNKAITVDPTRVQGYLGLADIYLKSSNKKKALDIVTSGLKNNPASKALQRRYLSLGGKAPFPAEELLATVEKQKSDLDTSKINNTEKEINYRMDTVIEERAPVTTGANNENKSSISQQKPVGPGKPNPYCRFCPPE